MKNRIFKAASALCALALTAGLTACTPAEQEHEHSFSANWSTSANNHWHACTGEQCDEHEGEAVHEFDGGVITEQPSCTANGTKTFTCSVCDYKKTEDVDSTGHDMVWKHNNSAHWQECSKGDSKGEVSAHVWGAGEVTQAGYESECETCGYDRAVPLAGTAKNILPLTVGEHSVYLTVGSLGLLDGSYYSFTPEADGAYELTSDMETAQLSVYADAKLAKRITSSQSNDTATPHAEWDLEAGQTYYIIVSAGETENTVVDFAFNTHTHKYEDKLYSENVTAHWYAGKDGCTSRKDYEKHTYGEWEEVTAPQGAKHGQEKQTCTGCGHESFRETHSFAEEWSSNATWHWHAALCNHKQAEKKEDHTFGEWSEVDGQLQKECSVCHYIEIGSNEAGSEANPFVVSEGLNSGTVTEDDFFDGEFYYKHYTFVASTGGTVSFTAGTDSIVIASVASFDEMYAGGGDFAIDGDNSGGKFSMRVEANQTLYIIAGIYEVNMDYSFEMSFNSD